MYIRNLLHTCTHMHTQHTIHIHTHGYRIDTTTDKYYDCKGK